ncbi:TRAP transporter small permease [Mesorhizobium sp. M9A.F.Ca.ET.002.03.1.2]|uniref:TRAP transporter small permease subunit n=1 Tax=Mesorhizobium sp. M9A.F.Ca.ET.002.03.1.2 TaxID=2493668 RepID=UPI000F7603F4|nr:TRAP transporter small permease [Mesorhizobium sp. M9A.F.Ca.ET.002.03.1.2]AZO01405.1 TRAP transporter small permease [Mesorhizobium sp. M9A.F.Ca.ET.002.03.1.2]
MLRLYIRSVGGLSRAFAVVATLLLIAAMLVVCQMILIRYVFRAATIWQTDFVVFAATGAMFLGAPYVLLTGGHVGVDVVEMVVTERTRHAMRIVASLLGLLFCAIMLYASWLQLHESWVGGWRHSSVWAPPLWIPLSALPLGFGMLCLQYVAQILVLLSGGAAPAPAHVPAEALEAAAAVSPSAEPQP